MSAIPAQRIESGIREINEDQPETVSGAMILPVGAPSDPTAKQQMRLVEQSGVLDFWDDPEEEVYSDDDGEPL